MGRVPFPGGSDAGVRSDGAYRLRQTQCGDGERPIDDRHGNVRMRRRRVQPCAGPFNVTRDRVLRSISA